MCGGGNQQHLRKKRQYWSNKRHLNLFLTFLFAAHNFYFGFPFLVRSAATRTPALDNIDEKQSEEKSMCEREVKKESIF